jgi:hypothetical protein
MRRAHSIDFASGITLTADTHATSLACSLRYLSHPSLERSVTR